MKKCRKKFLTELLKANQEIIIEAINGLKLERKIKSKDDKEITFSIEAIKDIDEISSTRIDYRLEIQTVINSKFYSIEEWFTYDYNSNAINLTDNYIKEITIF